MKLLTAFLCALFCVCGAAAFDVRDFGAKGDGKTDDTAAIQKALDHIAGRIKYDRFRREDGWYRGSTETHVDELFFPEGTYVVSKMLFANGSVSLRGVKGRTTIRMTDPKQGVFYGYIYRRMIFDGMIFDGGATQIDLWSNNWNASTVHVTDCVFRNASAPAFRSVGVKRKPVKRNEKPRRIPPYQVNFDNGVPRFTRSDLADAVPDYSSNIISVRNTEFLNCARAFEVNNDGALFDNCTITAAPASPGPVCLIGLGLAPNMITLRSCRLTAPASSHKQVWIKHTGFYLTLRDCSFESVAPMSVLDQETQKVPPSAGNIIIAGCSFRQGSPALPLVVLRRVTSYFVFRDNVSVGNKVPLFDWVVKPDRKYFETDSYRGKHEKIPWSLYNKYQFVFAQNKNITVNYPKVLEQFIHKPVPQLHTKPGPMPPLPENFSGELRAADFGVKADGKTDDADALERAAAAAAEAGKTLIIPQGRTRLSRTVKLPRKISLRGEGMPVIFGDRRDGYDLFSAERPIDIRFRNLILRNAKRILAGKLDRDSRCIVFHDTVTYDTGRLSILLTGGENTCRLDLAGSLWNGTGGIDSSAEYNNVEMCWFANNYWMDDMAFFTARRGRTVMQNGFFVPYVSKNIRRTNLATGETKVWPLGGHLRWVDNAGTRIFMYDCRGGGEAGGYCSYYHTAPGGFGVLEGGLARVTNKDTRNTVVYVKAVPEWILVCGVGGYPVHTLLGVRHRVWQKAPGVGDFPIFVLGSMTPQKGPEDK
ncbi:MAG: hypothetical protein IJU70_00730 [Lentisphaeria bacterium]|nr:hypothetical protein [Lentisphaeria bacterium]